MDVDSLIGVGAVGRFLGNLKDDDPIKGDGVIVGNRAALFKAPRLFNLL
jgi:hypothetical protein